MGSSPSSTARNYVTLGHHSISLSLKGHRWAEGLGVVPVPKATSQGCCERDGFVDTEILCQLSSALQVSITAVIKCTDNSNDERTASGLGIVWLCLVLMPGGR